MGKKNKERKERFRELQEEDKLQTMLEERKKSANERELERFIKEKREKQINKALEGFRKEREHEDNSQRILNAPNITNHSDFEILKEKNMFKSGNMFEKQRRI